MVGQGKLFLKAKAFSHSLLSFTVIWDTMGPGKYKISVFFTVTFVNNFSGVPKKVNTYSQESDFLFLQYLNNMKCPRK